MKKISFSLLCLTSLSLFTIASCDSPRSKSSRYTDLQATGAYPYQNQTFVPSGSSSTNNTSTNNNTGNNSTTSQLFPADSEFSHCQTNLTDLGSGGDSSHGRYNGYYSLSTGNTILGKIYICQSSTSELRIVARLEKDDGGEQTCIMASYFDSVTKGSTYMGNPYCLNNNDNELKAVTLNKNRSNIQNYPINELFIFKRNELEALNYCLSPNVYCSQQGACTQYYDPYCSCYKTSCNQSCLSYAQNTYCTQFKNRGRYIMMPLTTGANR